MPYVLDISGSQLLGFSSPRVAANFQNIQTPKFQMIQRRIEDLREFFHVEPGDPAGGYSMLENGQRYVRAMHLGLVLFLDYFLRNKLILGPAYVQLFFGNL
jgi:hypothetical protein